MSLSVQEIDNVVLAWKGVGPYQEPTIKNVTKGSYGYSYRVTSNVTVLASKYSDASDNTIQGALYVPRIGSGDPCRGTLDEVLPRKIVDKSDLPPTVTKLVAIAPWINASCTQSFLASARQDPIRVFIFYLTNDTASQPPAADSEKWDLLDGGRWKSENHYPVVAVSGAAGEEMMHHLSLYSGNVTEVPYGENISSSYDLDSQDYIRIWTSVSVSTSSNIPSLWVLVLIIICVVLGVIGATSLLMHLVQRRRRVQLRYRVESGEVNLEGMGIKRLTVPASHVSSFPLFTYSYDSGAGGGGGNHPPASPSAAQAPHRSSSAGSPVDGVAPGGLGSSEKTLGHPLTVTTTATDYQPACAICREAYQNRATVIRELPCGHIFHPECIDDFLTETSSLCPVCKASTLPRGYCPGITNSMVRRERAIRRLRDRVVVDEAGLGGPGGMLREWSGDVRRSLFARRRPGPSPAPAPAPTWTELEPRPPGLTALSKAALDQRQPPSTPGLLPSPAKTAGQPRRLAGLDPDDPEAQLPTWKRLQRLVFPGF